MFTRSKLWSASSVSHSSLRITNPTTARPKTGSTAPRTVRDAVIAERGTANIELRMTE